MASVFLSYDREDTDKARSIASALEKAGHSVWWDLHVRGGAQFSKVIEEALKAADAVVVLWSKQSIDSAWVRDEAAAGRDTGRLVPVTIDGTQAPLGFRQFQTIDLSKRRSGEKSAKLNDLLVAVAALGPAQAPTKPSEKGGDKQEARKRYSFAVGIAALMVVGALALLLWRPWSTSTTAPVVAVRAADQTPESSAFARDLLVQLGDYQAARPDTIEIVGDDASRRPDAIIEVSGRTSPIPSANLLLLRGRDRLLLASQELTDQEASASDVKQALSLSAVRLIDCAAEALSARPGLRSDLLKLYMGACARFGGLYGSDDIALITPQLEQVTKAVPSFVPAWRRLLLAGASLVSLPSDQPKPSRGWLQKQIEAAGKADPDLPEIGIAEVELLPATAFRQRLEKIAQVNARSSQNAAALDSYAEQLMAVGRNNDAVSLAEKATLIDRSSPWARATYVRALAYSGRLPASMQNLRDSIPLQLGSKNLLEARFRINMRYGDPKDALDLLHRYGTSKQHEAFLNARVDPSPANVREAVLTSRSVSDNLQIYGAHSEVLAAFGRVDELYQLLLGLDPAQVEQGLLSTLFRPNLKPLRQDPRFMLIAKRFGLLNFWQTSGKWPDFCSDPDLPYDCKKEAARLGA